MNIFYIQIYILSFSNPTLIILLVQQLHIFGYFEVYTSESKPKLLSCL